jgi:tripartite-type tricarboxylate transporter receptor subunit TctC
LIGGQVPFAVLDLTSAQPFIRAGRMRALGVTSAKRTPLAPEIPTIAEAGLPGFEVISWFGIIAPGGTPPEVVTRLNAELVWVLTHPESRDRLMAAGLEPSPSSQEEFGALIRAELAKMAGVIRASGIKAD